MARRSSILTIIGRALSASARNFHITLAASALYGISLAVVDQIIFSIVGVSNPPAQQDLPKVLLSMLGAQFGVEILLGPILAAFAVYVGRCAAEGKPGSLYKAVNFSLSRYSRVFFPHFVAWLSITLGMIIIVPGVLFLLQYAFVDAVACMEEEKSPLPRSKGLTRGRRKSLFLLALPWIILSQVLGFFQLWALSQSGMVMAAGDTVATMITFVMFVAFYLIYDERTRKRRAKTAASADADAAVGSPKA
jgi:MFS family permease